MKNRERTAVAASLAAFVVGWAQVAGAEEFFRQSQSAACLPDGAGCAQFQGYVYVHRDGEAAPPPAPVWGTAGAGVSDPGLDERRVYLHLGAAEAR